MKIYFNYSISNEYNVGERRCDRYDCRIEHRRFALKDALPGLSKNPKFKRKYRQYNIRKFLNCVTKIGFAVFTQETPKSARQAV